MTNSKDLPAIVATFNDIEEYTAQGKFKELLNQTPNSSWVKNHPFAKDVKYLPIDKVETMLDMIFQQWSVEILSMSQLAQSICCTIRLHYLNPITKEWNYHDGVGAVPLKTDKGFSASDLSHIKSDAVATGAPAAKSFAIKDAAEHLGKLFGRDLNRKETVAYNNLFENTEEELEESLDKIAGAKTVEDLQKVWVSLPKKVRDNEAVKVAAENAKKALTKQ